MAAAYTWHPGTGVERPRWVRSVPMLPDEIISSWLVRAALAQGCDPMVLTGEIWPKWRIWTRDVDRFLDETPLTRLVASSGIPLSFFVRRPLKKSPGKSAARPCLPKLCGHGYWRLAHAIRSGEAACNIVQPVFALMLFLISACNGVSHGIQAVPSTIAYFWTVAPIVGRPWNHIACTRQTVWWLFAQAVKAI